MKLSAPSMYWTVVLIGALSSTPGVSRSESVEQNYEALIAAEDGAVGRLSTQERSELVASTFDRHFGKYTLEDVSALSDADIDLYLRATELVLSNSLRKQDLSRMEVAFEEIGKRGGIAERTVQRMRSAYISMRMFDQAHGLARRHNLKLAEDDPTYLNDVPENYQGPTVLEISPTAAQLTRRPFLPPHGGHIVIVAHPLCHFSQRAIMAINEDATLKSLFAERASLLAPVDGRLNLDVIRSWNSTFPEFQVALAYSRDEWPGIDYWGTPTFYFFGKDKAVEKVVGWPPEGRWEELRAAARRVGLLGDQPFTSPNE